MEATFRVPGDTGKGPLTLENPDIVLIPVSSDTVHHQTQPGKVLWGCVLATVLPRVGHLWARGLDHTHDTHAEYQVLGGDSGVTKMEGAVLRGGEEGPGGRGRRGTGLMFFLLGVF